MIDQLAGDKIGDRERRRFHRSMPDSRASAWRLALSLFGFGHIRRDRAAGMRVLGVLLWEDPVEHSGPFGQGTRR